MFKLLRNKKTQKNIWIVLCILILPAFLLWGTGSNRLKKSPPEGTGINRLIGTKISQAEYDESVAAIRNQAIIQFGDAFAQMEKFLDIQNQAIDRVLLLREAKKRKITVSDTEVVNFLTTFSLFQVNNAFDKRTYEYILNYHFRTQARIFEEQIRQNLMLTKLYKIVTEAITLSDEEVKEAYRKENEQVSVVYILSTPDDFAKDITVSGEQLKDYYAKHSLDFKIPLSYNAESLAIESETVKNEVLERLKNKEDFLSIAKQLDLTVKETGFFSQEDPVPGIGWSPEIHAALAKLEINQVSPPIKSEGKYFLLRIKEKKEPHIPAFEEIKDKVKEAIIKEESIKLAQEKIKICQDEIKAAYSKDNLGKLDLDKYAKQFGLRSATTAAFTANSYIENIGASDQFFNEAKSLKENEISGIIAMPTGFYLIKVSSITPINEEKFETEKKEFAEKMLLQCKEEHFLDFIKQLKTKITGRP